VCLGVGVVILAERAPLTGRVDHAFVGIVAELGVVVLKVEG
jgi:hypothetical protein